MQRKAEKCIPDEEATINANIASFGDDIGKITNRVTSMFEVRAGFPEDSEEYKTLTYRIECGQHYQQNSIDKAKGIISEPMPKEWYSKVSIYETDLSDEEKEFNASIVADKKPYFMRYIYPDLKKQYDTYIKNTDKKALRIFHLSIAELMAKEELSEEESGFLSYYSKMMPVGINDCVMNRICRRFEEEFDHHLSKYKSDTPIDPSILKSGVEYSLSQRRNVQAVYKAYIARTEDYMMRIKAEHIDKDEVSYDRANMRQEFFVECHTICSNDEILCDIMVDLCYTRESGKYFLWLVSGKQVIENLLERNGRRIMYPVADDEGDIVFGGERFSIATTSIGGGA